MIQKICEKAGKYACLAFCYLKYMGHAPMKAITYYQKLMDNNIIDEDFYVKDGNAFIRYFGNTHRKVRFLEDGEEPMPSKYYICRYYNPLTGHRHFVITQGYKVVYDSLGESITVRDGRPEQFREIV